MESGASAALHMAVLCLVGDGSLRERVFGAYGAGLKAITPQDLPRSARVDFAKIIEPLTRVPGEGGDGDVLATLERIDDQETTEIAEKIFHLYAHVSAAKVRRDTAG